MANYVARTRSNYFLVTDEEKYRNIRRGLRCSDDEVLFWDETRADGQLRHAFGGYGVFDYGRDYPSIQDYLDRLESEDPDKRPVIRIAEDVADLDAAKADLRTCEDICDRAEDLKIWKEEKDADGTILLFVSEEPDDWAGLDIEKFYKAMQEILPEGEAMIITEVGNEKLRYVYGVSVIVTKDTITYVNLDTETTKAAKKALGNPEYTADSQY